MRSKTSVRFRLSTICRYISPSAQQGLSLVELTAAMAVGSLILAALGGVIAQALQTERVIRANNDVHRQARFAMQQMLEAVSHSQRLILPLGENTATAWSESIRDPGVLAVTLNPKLDRNKDGWADANNDQDYLDLNNNGSRQSGEPERIDEDVSHDMTNDGFPGIIGIDDDGDGLIDEGSENDDDEDGAIDEDEMLSGDNDNDGAEDEDFSFDSSNDNEPGISGIDDDYDGNIDEGNKDDDDEDGLLSEDWYDPVVFYLSGTTLMQRIPNINPSDGTDYSEYPIAENVSQFRVERIPQGGGRGILIDISLTLTNDEGEPAQLNTRLRIGAAL